MNASICNIRPFDAWPVLSELAKRSGYYRNNGRWLKYGRITMRRIDRDKPIDDAIFAEAARRNIMAEADVKAKVEATVLPPLDQELVDLSRLLYDHPNQQAAMVIRANMMVVELAGGESAPAIAIGFARGVIQAEYWALFCGRQAMRAAVSGARMSGIAQARNACDATRIRYLRSLADVIGLPLADAHRRLDSIRLKIVG